MHLTANRVAAVLCLYFIALALTYARATPPLEAPDEGAHFLYIHNVLETRQLPVLRGRRTVFASGSVQRHQPPLYYLLGAGLIAWTDRSDSDLYLRWNPFRVIGFIAANNHNVYFHSLSYPGDTGTAVWVLRLYSIALAVGTLWCVYRAGQIAFPGKPVGLTALALVASIPGFVAVSASINNDNLVTLAFAAGVYWSLRLWRRRAIDRLDIFALSLILSAAAISKLTGLALFPLVYGAVLYGAWRGYYPLRRVLLLIGVTLGATALLAGWWYLRNLQLYGDPLALRATLRIWARGQAVSEGLDEILFEAKGIWDSFWMTLAHLSIRAPEWLYTYAPILTLGGLVGLIPVCWRFFKARGEKGSETPLRLRSGVGQGLEGLLLLLLVCLVSITVLAVATQRINISQGRLLYPMLVGFAPLLMLGWRGLLGRWSVLVVIPLALLTVYTGVVTLPASFAPLERVDALPADVRRIDARAESLTLLGYRFHEQTAAPGQVVHLDVYFSGTHADNPALFVKILDPVTFDTLGGIDVYPGMSPTDELAADAIYHTTVAIFLDQIESGKHPPIQVKFMFGWRVPDPERFLPWVDGQGRPLDLLAVPGFTLIDPTVQPPSPQHPAEATFGNAIRLFGYTITPSGETLEVTLHWRALRPMDTDYTLTLALVDAEGRIVAQADGMPSGYPTSAWRIGIAFADARALTIPPDAVRGVYRVYVGWYLAPDGARLAAVGDGVQDDLFFLPTVVYVGG